MLFVSFCLWMEVAIIIDDGVKQNRKVLLLTLELEGVKFRNCVKQQNEHEKKKVKHVYSKY